MKSFIKLFYVFFSRKSIIILTLATMLIGISSCASDDKSEIVENTFLKRFAGEKWEYIGDDLKNTYRFNDDLLNPLVIWQQKENIDTSCYYFHESYEDEFEIIEQTNDTFIIDITWINGNRWQRIRFEFFVNEKGNIQSHNTPLTKTDKIHVICYD